MQDPVGEQCPVWLGVVFSLLTPLDALCICSYVSCPCTPYMHAGPCGRALQLALAAAQAYEGRLWRHG